MGALVVIEGLDGAGKQTLAAELGAALERRGARVASLAFPRYGEDVHADLAADALHGRLGDLADSVYAMALLFALDRRGARGRLEALLASSDVVLADRYIASNAAYSAARLGQDADGPFVDWLRELEVARFGVRVPELQLLLDVEADVAGGRASGREVADPGRARDAYESDAALQRRCHAVYRQLAERDWLAPWRVVDGAGSVAADELAATLLG